MRSRVAAAVLVASLGSAGPAAADDQEMVFDGAWHLDGRVEAVVPVGTSSYAEVSSFGGGLAARAYRDWLEAELQLAVMARDGSDRMEQVVDRVRLLGGARWVRPGEMHRAIIVRGLAGLELTGFDTVGTTDWLAETHRVGFAVGGGIESRSDLGWGIVSLCFTAMVSSQPFGDDEGARYLTAIELLPGIAVGF